MSFLLDMHTLHGSSLRWLILLMILVPSYVAGSDVSLWDIPPTGHRVTVVPTSAERQQISQLYQQMGLEGRLSFEAFSLGVRGYNQISNKHRSRLTIVDFSKPSTQERMFVFDMEQGKLLYATLCAHGRGSGENYATSFSNQPNSHQSSLGFYLTNETYSGSNGYSLRLDGLERGYNDQARARAIVVHGAAYVNDQIIRQGRLGRSYGCPAVPRALARPIIDAIKGGSVLYIYANRPDYLAQSMVPRSEMEPTRADQDSRTQLIN